MKRILITSALFLGLGMNADIFADHTRASIRDDYEIQRVELENDYRARRDANRFQYHRDRDIFRAERHRATRLDCVETRAIRVRAINRALSALARDFAVRNRGLASWYHRERDLLRNNYELALYNTRVARPIVLERPVISGHPHEHPANCECSICSPPEPVTLRPQSACRPVATACGYDGYSDQPVGFSNYHRTDVPAILRNDPPHIEPVSYRNERRSVDWASLLLSFLANSSAR